MSDFSLKFTSFSGKRRRVLLKYFEKRLKVQVTTDPNWIQSKKYYAFLNLNLNMTIISEQQTDFNLINLNRLAHIIKSLDEKEIETLEILLDNDSFEIIQQSSKEYSQQKGIPIDQW